MTGAIQALLAPLQALAVSTFAAIEARVMAGAALAIRRAVLLIAATLMAVGALLFLSIGIFFALLPGIGPAGAALVMAFLWAVMAGLCVIFARLRPRTVAPPVAAPAPAAAVPTAPVPPVAAASAVPPAAPAGPAPGAAPAAAVPPRGLRARVARAAPILALGALVAGILAGRR